MHKAARKYFKIYQYQRHLAKVVRFKKSTGAICNQRHLSDTVVSFIVICRNQDQRTKYLMQVSVLKSISAIVHWLIDDADGFSCMNYIDLVLYRASYDRKLSVICTRLLEKFALPEKIKCITQKNLYEGFHRERPNCHRESYIYG